MEKEKIKSCIKIVLDQMVRLIENAWEYDDADAEKEKIKNDALELILGYIPEQLIVFQEPKITWTDTTFTSSPKTFPFKDPTRTTCTDYLINNNNKNE